MNRNKIFTFHTIMHVCKRSLFTLFVLLLAAGCSKDNEEDNGGNVIVVDPVNPQNKPSWTIGKGRALAEVPAWTPIPDELLSSSMTVTVGLDKAFTEDDIDEEGDMLAAFCGTECLGVSNIRITSSGEARAYMYVLPPTGTDRSISFSYYSKKKGRLYCWPNKLQYKNNDIVGTTREPYTLSLEEENYGFRYRGTVCIASSVFQSFNTAADELSVFLGNECRMVMRKGDYNQEEKVILLEVPIDNNSDKITLHYYSSAQDRIFVSQEFAVISFGNTYINQVNWQ